MRNTALLFAFLLGTSGIPTTALAGSAKALDAFLSYCIDFGQDYETLNAAMNDRVQRDEIKPFPGDADIPGKAFVGPKNAFVLVIQEQSRFSSKPNCAVYAPLDRSKTEQRYTETLERLQAEIKKRDLRAWFRNQPKRRGDTDSTPLTQTFNALFRHSTVPGTDISLSSSFLVEATATLRNFSVFKENELIEIRIVGPGYWINRGNGSQYY